MKDTSPEMEEALFLRFYGHEFDAAARERILARMADPLRPGVMTSPAWEASSPTQIVARMVDGETGDWIGMPEIARFFGIIIRMFAEPAAPHHRPHFHAY